MMRARKTGWKARLTDGPKGARPTTLYFVVSTAACSVDSPQMYQCGAT